jgi:hypothetical protein
MSPDDSAVRRANPTIRKGMITMRTVLLMRSRRTGFLGDTLIIARRKQTLGSFRQKYHNKRGGSALQGRACLHLLGSEDQ